MSAIEFDGYAKEPPAGDWAYILDDFNVRYQPGPWPFAKPGADEYLALLKRKAHAGPAAGCGVFSVRLSPDTGYGTSGRNEHVIV